MELEFVTVVVAAVALDLSIVVLEKEPNVSAGSKICGSRIGISGSLPKIFLRLVGLSSFELAMLRCGIINDGGPELAREIGFTGFEKLLLTLIGGNLRLLLRKLRFRLLGSAIV